MGQQQGQGEQLTPDMIAALIKSGALTPDVAEAKLTPQEKAIYHSMASSMGPISGMHYALGSDPNAKTDVKGPNEAAVMGPGIALKAALGSKAAQGVPSAISDLAARHPMATAAAGAGLSQLSKKLGVPPEIANVLSEMFAFRGAMGGSPSGASGLAEGEASAYPANVIRSDPAKTAMIDQAEKNVFGAAPRSPYPPNIDTQSSTDDIARMIGDHSGQGPTPTKWNDPALRSSVEKLKRVVLRQPGGQDDDND